MPRVIEDDEPREEPIPVIEEYAADYLPRHLGHSIFYNGHFITLEELQARGSAPLAADRPPDFEDVARPRDLHQVEALGVVNGIIVALGSEMQVRRALLQRVDEERHHNAEAPATIHEIDLQGHVAIPGFIASHEHLAVMAEILPHLDLRPSETVPNKAVALEKIRAAAAIKRRLNAAHPGQAPDWVIGFHYDEAAKDFTDFTREELDEASPDVPVLIYHFSLHSLYFNSQAMAQTGGSVHDAIEDPDGGHFSRDAHRLTGIASENAMSCLSDFSPGVKDYSEALTRAGLFAASKGVTTTFDLWTKDSNVAKYYSCFRLHGSGGQPPFPVRLGYYLAAPASEMDPQLLQSSPWLRFLGYKFCIDGSLSALHTAALTRPYHDCPHSYGCFRDFRQIRELLIKYHCAGYQIALHNNGDAALDWTLAALREAQYLCPRTDTRHRIEHAQTARPDQLRLMAELGVVANFFINHVWYYGDRHYHKFLGPKRATVINPLHTAARAGVSFALHNDCPVTPLNPLMSLWVSAVRRTREGMYLGPQETVSVLRALRGYTIDAAYQGFEERVKGTLEVGKYADFVVLSDNIFNVPLRNLCDIDVKMTVQAGHITHSDFSIAAPPELTFWARMAQRTLPQQP